MDFSVFLQKEYQKTFVKDCICSVVQLDMNDIIEGFENATHQLVIYNVYYNVEVSQFRTQVNIWIKDDVIESSLFFCRQLNKILKDKVVLSYTEEYFILIDERGQQYLARELEGDPSVDVDDQFFIDLDNLIVRE